MADIRKFSDITGEPIELKACTQISNEDFAARWPGVRGLRADGYTKWAGHPMTGTGGMLPVTRMITFKSFPSKHECNAKCLGGKHTGTCECKCGGRNHGAGMFTSLTKKSTQVELEGMAVC
jgi:hypothetical protein